MSRVTKLKHVMKVTDDYALPTDNQEIVQVFSSKGNNLHEVVSSSEEEHYLVSMPTKFRKNFWVRRGDFVIVEPIAEGGKVKAEIVRVLTAKDIKWFKTENIWPSKFESKDPEKTGVPQDDPFDISDDVKIQNRVEIDYPSDCSD